MPKPTLCPKCKTNPRRAPGNYCIACHVHLKRERRHAVSAAHRVASETPVFKRQLRETKRYIVTSAQNNTRVNPEFFEALKVAAKHLKAEIIVVPYRYKNPTGMQPGKDLRECALVLERKNQHDAYTCRRFVKHTGPCSLEPDGPDELWWDPQVLPYLHNARTRLNANLVLAADVKIQPTATKPLSGLESLTGAESCIIASPKLQFRTVAVPSQAFPKILTTTGACTVPNYSNTKSGAIGEFHYTLGACLAEIDGKLFHLRQLLGVKEDGSFIDLDKHYSEAGVRPAPPALGLVMGDTHVRVTDPGVDRATFGRRGIVETLNPKTLVFHDLFDGETVNPHEVGDPFLAEAKRRAQRQDVKAELQQVVEFVNKRAGGREVVVVDSNHHDFLRRWVRDTDWKKDLKNADLYLELARYMLNSAQMTPGGATYGDPFRYCVQKFGAKTSIRCLKPDESFKIGSIECSMHGHAGPNGSRGSLQNLSRLGVKSFIGHGHGPGIEEGGCQVGTSTSRRLAYQRGPGNHLNTHGTVYANGKRCLITIIGDLWRLQS